MPAPRTPWCLALGTSLVVALSLSLPALAEDDPDVALGKALIEANCARCHGIGTADESPHRDAPEFRTLPGRYPLEALEENLGVGP